MLQATPMTCGLRGRRGAVMVWVVVSLGVIIGVVALGMDGGRMLEERRHAVAVADTAALAAAAELFENYSLNQGLDLNYAARDAARAIAAANGYTNDGTTSTVTVNIPPLSGPFIGRPGYAEVLVERRLEPGFGGIFTQDDLVVRARGVALGRPRQLGIVVLRPDGNDAFLSSGNGLIEVVGAGIQVNSSDSLAFKHSGSAVVKAASLDITGNYSANGGLLQIGSIRTGVPPVPDPLQFLPAPNLADYPVRSTGPFQVPGFGFLPTVLQPGVYQGGIEIASNTLTILNSGIYIMDGGGFKVASNGVVAGNEVMIYNAEGKSGFPGREIDIATNADVILTPLQTGVYAGICIFQDRALDKKFKIGSDPPVSLTGVVYLAAATFEISGNGIVALNGALICNTLKISGNGSFVVKPGNIGPKLPDVRLVE